MSKALPLSRVPDEVRWLSAQLRPYVCWHMGSFLCTTGGSLLGLLTPLILKWLIDQVLPKQELGLLIGLVALLFAVYQGRNVLVGVGTYLNLNGAQRMSLALSMRVLRKLDSLSSDYYESTSVGTAIYPMKQPIEEIAYFGSDLLPSMLRLCSTSCFTILAMFMLNRTLTITVLPLIPVFLVLRHRFRKKLRADSDAVQSSRIVWSDFLQEHLASIIPIQLLRRQRRQERKAFCFLGKTFRAEQKLFRTSILFAAFTSGSVALAMSWVIGYGGWSVLARTMSVGSLVAFYGFVTQLFEPLSSVAELYARAQRAFASVRQVKLVLGLHPSIEDSVAAVVLPEQHSWQVDFDAVEFGYQRQKNMVRIPVLQIAAGERIAITGENGAGKSTLAKLIARIYDVDSGTVSIGGRDVRNIQLDSLRQHVAYLPRDPILFGGSIEDNICFARPTASGEEVREVITCSDLSPLIGSIPDGMYQELGPGCCQLSGGQRQRLAIARALLVRPRILILDEATSCLDPVSEELVIKNIQKHLSASTVIVISHRFSTITCFDRVLVMANGRIVRDGMPDIRHRVSQAMFGTDRSSQF